jgi:hypothetical protein
VDLETARRNAAVAAAATLGLANAPTRIGPRQSRAEVEGLLVRNKLDHQMRVYSLWDDWETGSRGRAKN